MAPDDPSGGPTASIEGTLEHVVFRNPVNHYLIGRLKLDDRAMPVTVRGILPGVDVGERLRISGRWIDDPQYGRQLQASSFLPIRPDTADGLLRRLAGKDVQGIGPVFAERLVRHFGAEQLIDVLDNHPERLLEVDGIGRGRASQVIASWRRSRDRHDALIFLQGLGLPAGLSSRVYRKYREQTVRRVRDNPYRLAVDVTGVGFLTADRVAKQLGIDKDSPYRLRAGLSYTLGEALRQGHCFLPEAELLTQSVELLGVDGEAVACSMEDLLGERALLSELLADSVGDRLPPPAADQRPAPEGARSVWLPEVLADEEEAAETLATLLRVSARAVTLDVPAAIRWAEERSGLHLGALQREALSLALREKVVVITGGPGTGKTTLVRALIAIWERKGLQVRLAAPTGRAARRLEETTQRKASTLHRMLEFSPQHGRFLRDRSHTVRGDVFVVDESSMIDLPLLRALLAGLPEAARLVFVGDVDQLPSVGHGRVLGDLIDSGRLPVVRLDVVFRQDRAGLIVDNAHRLLRGLIPRSAEGPDGDFFFIQRDSPAAAVRTVLQVVAERIPSRWGLDPLNDVQVLVPMRKGEVGAEALNESLRDTLNPATGPSEGRPPRFRPGDRVMQIRNDYDKDVFNGDIGRVLGPGAAPRSLSVQFDGRTLDYEMAEQDDLELAYAITIHKSQGSEYPAVVVPLLTQHFRMLQRNLLYTAITRGRSVVVVVGSRRALEIAVGRADADHRWTGLEARLRTALPRAAPAVTSAQPSPSPLSLSPSPSPSPLSSSPSSPLSDPPEEPSQ